MSPFAAIVSLAVLVAPVLAVPTVDLLIDHGAQSSGDINLRTILAGVSKRKGQTFHFGSTFDVNDPNQSFNNDVFSVFFNHVVAENGCKWDATEPTQGNHVLTSCTGVENFANTMGNTFRGHNTFWHEQLPNWLPGGIGASQLVNTIIPQHVTAEISGLGASVTSWDVANEVVGDGVTNGMTALQCVQNKKVWPTVTSDGSNTPLVTDLSFLHSAFSAAFKAAGPNTRLALNDFNTGANDAKTACEIAVLKDIQANTGIPFSNLAIGFQSHIQETFFPSKAALTQTFSTLAGMGVQALITELDIKLSSTTQADLRFQAAIWGDMLDVCLFASNCNEFINWNTRDDVSFLGVAAAGTLFDKNGSPKPAAFEVAARLNRFANGGAELCATALGTGSCRVS